MMTVGAARATGTTCTVRTARAVGERGLEHALQFGGLVAGQLAAGDFALDQVVDLGFQIAGWFCATGLVAGPAALQRGIDIGQGGRQRVLVGGADGARSYFRLQLSLQLLERRLVGVGGSRRNRSHDCSTGFKQGVITVRLIILTRPFHRPPGLLPLFARAATETFGNKNPSPIARISDKRSVWPRQRPTS